MSSSDQRPPSSVTRNSAGYRRGRSSYSHRYAGSTASLASAREHLDTLLADHGIDDALRFDATLVANELFTNAARASPLSGYAAQASVEHDPPQLSMTVTNLNETDEPVSLTARSEPPRDSLAPSGRGLAIVDALTSYFSLVVDATGLIRASFTMDLA